ncbi:Mediator of RNA polymerase II transcription subunit 23, partial [Blomia tropicalis]
MFMNESEISYLVGLSHAFWNHGSIGQICSLEQFLKERIKPIIQNEEQFLFVCYLVGPFLDRFSIERTRCVMDIVTELYGMLEIIDKKCPKLKHVDKICDLLYHIKYQFTGDLIKKKLENPIKNMKPELSNKLRFISNIVTTTDKN